MVTSTLGSDSTANHDIAADPTDATDAFDGASGTATEVAGTYGSFELTRNDTTGALSWTYTLDSTVPAIQALRDGQEAYEKLAVKVADDGGASA